MDHGNREKIGIQELRWQCRRGLLELDYLLEEFLENHYEQLSHELQQAFVTLLDCPDPELQQWLLAGVNPDDMGLRQLTTIMRESVEGID